MVQCPIPTRPPPDKRALLERVEVIDQNIQNQKKHSETKWLKERLAGTLPTSLRLVRGPPKDPEAFALSDGGIMKVQANMAEEAARDSPSKDAEWLDRVLASGPCGKDLVDLTDDAPEKNPDMGKVDMPCERQVVTPPQQRRSYLYPYACVDEVKGDIGTATPQPITCKGPGKRCGCLMCHRTVLEDEVEAMEIERWGASGRKGKNKKE